MCRSMYRWIDDLDELTTIKVENSETIVRLWVRILYYTL